MTSVVKSLPAAALVAALLASAGAAAQPPAVVRIVVPIDGEGTVPAYEAAAEAFMAEHPDIRIAIEPVQWDALFQTLTAGLSEGTPPDLAIVATGWLADLVAGGDLEPLDDRISDGFAAAFIQALLAPAQIDGRLWGLPAAASARAMYCNRNLLDAAGVAAPPATWDQLEEAARAVAALGDDIHGFGLQGDAIETDVYYYYALWSHGGALIEEDGSSGLDSEAAIAAAAMYRRFVDEGLTQPDVGRHNREDLQDLFAAGRLGCLVSSPLLARRLADEVPGLRWVVAPIPAGSERATYGVTDTMVMFAASASKDEAWRFVEHLFEPEWRQEVIAGDGFLPTTVAVAASVPFTADPVAAVFAAALADARFLPAIANWDEIADVTSNALRRLYGGEHEPAEALTAAAAEVDALLGRTPNAQ